MWRDTSTVYVRSSDGRARRYESATQAIDALVRKLPVAAMDANPTNCAPNPLRTLADVVAGADPYALMDMFVEAAVQTLQTRVPINHQDGMAVVLSQQLADRLEHYRSMR